MTQSQRNAAILSKIRTYTITNTVSQKAAQAALVREGFYLKNGKVAPEFDDEEQAKASA